MSKKIFFILLLTTIASLIFPTMITAVDTCSIRTDPDPLLNEKTDWKAGFYINVGDKTKYPELRVKFNCGINSLEAKPVKYSDTEIFVGLDKTDNNERFPPCEFNPGDHTVEVSLVNSNGKQLLCQGTYVVIDRAAKDCKLTLDPSTGITSNTIMKVKGTGIKTSNSVGEGMNLFFDKDAIDIPNEPLTGMANKQLTMMWKFGNVSMPEFEKTIDQPLMTRGTHTVSLRQRKFDLINTLIILNPQSANFPKPEIDYFSNPYCQTSFEVGTPDKPGGVLTPGTAVVADVCKDHPDQCAKGGGKICEGDTSNRGPGIATAIGCIHTNPTELVKDLMTFLVGIGGGLAFLMMLLGAFQMLTSAGNPETLAAGRSRLTSAIIGLLIIIFAVLLMQIIGVGILAIPGFK